MVKRTLPFLIFLLLLSPSLVLAHVTLVLGEVSVSPEAPAPGEPFTLTVALTDPTQVPVEDAYMFAELRPQEQPDAEPVRADFEETSTGGTYQATSSLPEAGAYEVVLRDQTYRQEEASATLATPLRLGSPNETQSFVFPPTAVSGASLRTWLLWVLGLPIVAGVVVTVFVLTRGDEKPKAA